jgi:type I restriction enzyme M protein
LEQITEQKNVLTPGRYVGSEAEEDDGIPFEEKMAALTAKLNEQFSRSNDLQDVIRKNLSNLGCD